VKGKKTAVFLAAHNLSTIACYISRKEAQAMQETGLVISVKDDFAVVKVERDVPADCCNKTSRKEACFVEARNLCNAEANARVSVETEDTPGPSMKILVIGLCAIGFIAGLILGEKISALPGLSPYRDVCSLGFAVVLAGGTFALSRYFARRGKTGAPVISEILYD
jgi:hypothetical protein